MVLSSSFFSFLPHIWSVSPWKYFQNPTTSGHFSCHQPWTCPLMAPRLLKGLLALALPLQSVPIPMLLLKEVRHILLLLSTLQGSHLTQGRSASPYNGPIRPSRIGSSTLTPSSPASPRCLPLLCSSLLAVPGTL